MRGTCRPLVEAVSVNLQLFSIEPAKPLLVALGRRVLFADAVKAHPRNGNRISARIPVALCGGQVQLTIRTAEGNELIAAEAKRKQVLADHIMGRVDGP